MGQVNGGNGWTLINYFLHYVSLTMNDTVVICFMAQVGGGGGGVASLSSRTPKHDTPSRKSEEIKLSCDIYASLLVVRTGSKYIFWILFSEANAAKIQPT